MVTVTQTLDLTGKLLIAMPGMGDKRFDNSVIYLCSYSAQGTMGLILNQPMAQASFGGLCKQLSIENSAQRDIPVLCGGPVEANRGFVLHSRDYHSADSTQHLNAGSSQPSDNHVNATRIHDWPPPAHRTAPEYLAARYSQLRAVCIGHRKRLAP